MEKLPNIEIANDNFGETISKLSDLAGITVYEYLNATNDKDAKQEFLDNPDLTHPQNEYGKLDIDWIHDNLDAINYTIIDADDWRKQELCELVADLGRREYDFLAANYEYNHAATPGEKSLAAEHHRAANEALYGKPDEDTFYAILSEEISKIKVDTLSPEARQKYDDLMAKIGPIKEVPGGTYKPKAETVQRFSELVQAFYEPFLRHVPEDQESFTPEEMKNIFNEVISEEFGGENPYKAIVTSEVSNVDVRHDTREIRFPENVKAPYSNTSCKTLLVHELGTHILRAIPYLGQEIEIFTSGLPGNETFDEGIAKCVEQAIEGKYKDSGREHYINIGLATFKNKNFREVYDITSTLKELTGKKNTTTINSVQRCFRGTGELPNNKDLAYYNGSVRVWKYIEEHIDDPNLFDDLFLSGKANIEDDKQARLVYEMKTRGENW